MVFPRLRFWFSCRRVPCFLPSLFFVKGTLNEANPCDPFCDSDPKRPLFSFATPLFRDPPRFWKAFCTLAFCFFLEANQCSLMVTPRGRQRLSTLSDRLFPDVPFYRDFVEHALPLNFLLLRCPLFSSPGTTLKTHSSDVCNLLSLRGAPFFRFASVLKALFFINLSFFLGF